ncbi:protein JINGUBANG-like [Impatiens glandulifera]|uniref:protein JINGUBANG-like n=1 Tax=Impatiens glandulifera TaxID=253017 RepID=UPI001FB19EE9|nr:protein JINGUBANG-like [Impatiens glandulifera]
MSNFHNHCVVTLKGSNSYISSLAIAGKFLCIGNSDKEILLWKRDSLISGLDHELIMENNTIATGKGAVKFLVVLADKLFSAHQDHKIRVWQIDGHGVDDNNHPFTHLATLPTLTDRAIKLLNPNNNVQIRRHKKTTWVHHVDTVSSLALSQDESLLYSVSWDRTLKVWQTNNFKCLESVRNAHDDAINAVAITNDGYVYTGSTDKKIKVWKKGVGQKRHSLVATLEKHHSGVNALAVSSDGSVIFSGASDKSIVAWERNGNGDGNMVAVGELIGHTKAVLCLTVVDHLLFSGSADRTIRIWREMERYCYSCFAVLEGHRGPVKCLAAASTKPNNVHDATTKPAYLLYSGSLDCELKVWQIFVALP